MSYNSWILAQLALSRLRDLAQDVHTIKRIREEGRPMGRVGVVEGTPTLCVYERAILSGAFEISILQAKYVTSEALT